jgi:hypothetical protein
MSSNKAGHEGSPARPVDHVTLPPDDELPPAVADFFESFARPGPRGEGRSSRSSGSTGTVTWNAAGRARRRGRSGRPALGRRANHGGHDEPDWL